MKSGSASLPLHGGHCPPGLFEHMKQLGGAMTEAIVRQFSREELLRRVSDPGWFQAFGCVLGFDWHSSGLTTVVCGALKEAINPRASELGIYIAGGKGNEGLQTPRHIETFADTVTPSLPVDDLKRTSRMTAQVDSSAVHDGHDIYHHCLFLTKDGDWSVIQQGMNEDNDMARRYHWLGLEQTNLIDEPHEGICAERFHSPLDLTHPDSIKNRKLCAATAVERPHKTVDEYERLLDHWDSNSRHLNLPERHDIPRTTHLKQSIKRIYDEPINDFKDLLGVQGVGTKTIRALSMISEVVWGAEPSYEDPARYSFAHGGKDGHPYPVDHNRYQQSIKTLKHCLEEADTSDSNRMKGLQRLSGLTG